MKPIETERDALEVTSPASEPKSNRTSTRVLDEVAEATIRRVSEQAVPVLRSARLVDLAGGDATVAWRGSDATMRALVASEVDRQLLIEALEANEPVLVEWAPGSDPIIVGLLQTRRARDVKLTGDKVEIRADSEILLRTGKAGVRLRKDGDIELVGSRISAVSRGLFRLVGRMLRLN
jgi:hypothetical protein